ncbi:uncharacterized protein LOC122615600 [Drosophila teissieri]|uniref:uncharacterized protein LOC122615600 n=1 Tax=Drosophila teissieri TaxID=7243 RepID=UPI001CBA12C0|nr:uncharacterized protein LOC122615600 [Drosophila teissieri]
MRVLEVIALLAFLAISAVMAHPSANNSSDQGLGFNLGSLIPFPRFPNFGGIGQ